MVFKTEKQLFDFFEPQVQILEKKLNDHKKPTDIKDSEVPNLEDELDETLEQPAEIWFDEKTLAEYPVFHFIRPIEKLDAFHVSCTYVSAEDEPTFIFLHFLTRDLELIAQFRDGDLVYDRAFEEVEFGMLEGDSLSDGDPLSMGLFLAMLKVRSDKDVPYAKFKEIGAKAREETIENADEIWRSNDLRGNVLVTFIREDSDSEISGLHYLAVTQEDPDTSTHSLLFSFPTTDENLIDRYRHGENLQAEEVSQESSH